MEWTREQRYRKYKDWDAQTLLNLQAQAATSPYQMHYHIHPLSGLINDPNGFSYYNGEYHLFCQSYPFGPVHGVKSWIHYLQPAAAGSVLSKDYRIIIFLHTILCNLPAQFGGCPLVSGKYQNAFHRLVEPMDYPYIPRTLQIVHNLAHHIRLPDPGGLRRDSRRLMAYNYIIIFVKDSLLIHPNIHAFLSACELIVMRHKYAIEKP